MSTLREWLTDAGFDWTNGRIVYQVVDSYCPGWGSPISGEFIDSTHYVLDEQFESGYGAPRCPRIIARDSVAIYFPGQYDGRTWLERIVIDLDRYVGDDFIISPYPGG